MLMENWNELDFVNLAEFKREKNCSFHTTSIS